MIDKYNTCNTSNLQSEDIFTRIKLICFLSFRISLINIIFLIMNSKLLTN